MILYADASALVKRYVTEPGSKDVNALIAVTAAVATSIVSRAEVSAAFGRAVRMRVLDDATGRRAERRFSREWPDLVRISATEALIERAAVLAWEYRLRGYDAVHLAAALTWREAVGEPVTLATFDRQLWEAAAPAGLEPWPTRLAG